MAARMFHHDQTPTRRSRSWSTRTLRGSFRRSFCDSSSKTCFPPLPRRIAAAHRAKQDPHRPRQHRTCFGSSAQEAQGLQWFLSESNWIPEEINRRRVEIMLEDPRTAPTAGSALVVDETGDRKDGKAT